MTKEFQINSIYRIIFTIVFTISMVYDGRKKKNQYKKDNREKKNLNLESKIFKTYSEN